ncbi:glycine cleavage system protein GcvH [Thermosulfuriphilus sp.]
MQIPEDLLYSEGHLWVKKEGRNKARIGLTAFGRRVLGEVIDIELPEEGEEIAKDEAFGSLESTRKVVDLMAPVSGEVLEINETIIDTPETINEDPYDEGWLIRIKLTDPEELEDLMGADEYEEFIEGQDIPEDEDEEGLEVFEEEE